MIIFFVKPFQVLFHKLGGSVSKKSTNTKQRREIEEENQHHHMRAQRVRDQYREIKQIDRALKTRNYEQLTKEDIYE